MPMGGLKLVLALGHCLLYLAILFYVVFLSTSLVVEYNQESLDAKQLEVYFFVSTAQWIPTGHDPEEDRPIPTLPWNASDVQCLQFQLGPNPWGQQYLYAGFLNSTHCMANMARNGDGICVMKGNWSCAKIDQIPFYGVYKCTGTGESMFFSSVRWLVQCPNSSFFGCGQLRRNDPCVSIPASSGKVPNITTFGPALAWSFSYAPFNTNYDFGRVAPLDVTFVPVPSSVFQVPLGISQVRFQRSVFNGKLSYQSSVFSRNGGPPGSVYDATGRGLCFLEFLPDNETQVHVYSAKDFREYVYLGDIPVGISHLFSQLLQ